jgi:hypothetical protein
VGALAFAVAALLYLVTEELLREAHERPDSALSTAMFFMGFLLLLMIQMQMSGSQDGTSWGRRAELAVRTRTHTRTRPFSSTCTERRHRNSRPPDIATEKPASLRQ